MGKYQHAIIVGASSGIGAELVRQLAQSGCKVAAVARRREKLDELAAEFPGLVFPVVHDVTKFDDAPSVFQATCKEIGGLDYICYAAGVMPDVGFHEYNFEKDRQMIEVNVLGMMAWLNQAAIRFEGTKSGTIAAIGSVAGERGRSGQPAYNTSKAAVATYMEGLRNRLSRYGVIVSTIKPGPTQTEMTEHLHLKGAMDPRKAAEIVLAKSAKNGEHYVKFTHRVAFAIIKNIPSPIFRKLKI